MNKPPHIATVMADNVLNRIPVERARRDCRSVDFEDKNNRDRLCRSRLGNQRDKSVTR